MLTPDTDYFADDADIAIIGCGKTVEQAFETAAQAVFAIVTNADLEPYRMHIAVLAFLLAV